MLNFKIWLEASKCELVQDKVNPSIHKIVGNAYPIRDTLKDLGFQYDYQLKQWYTYAPLTPALKETLHKLGVILPNTHLYAEPSMVELAQDERGWFLRGYTYPLKNIIKSLGFKWDGIEKKWRKNKISPKTQYELEKLGIKFPQLIS